MFCFWISISISFKSSWILSGVILKKRLYSSSSSNQNYCNKVLSIPRLLLLVNHGFTHTVLNLFFFCFVFFLRIHWRLLTILKTSNKSVWSNVFRYVKVCMFWKCIQYTLLFFFRELQLIMVLLLISDSYMSWSARFVSLKLCAGFSIFDSVLLLLKFIFLFNKMHECFAFKTS